MEVAIESGDILTLFSNKNHVSGKIIISLLCEKRLVGYILNYKETVEMIQNGKVSLINGDLSDFADWYESSKENL